MTTQHRLRLRISTFFTSVRSEGEVVADLIESNWTELYMFPLFLGNERFAPKSEDLIPQVPPEWPTPCDNPQPLRPMPVKVGQVTGFSCTSEGAFVDFEITSDELNFNSDNWHAHVEFTPRLNNPRDCVTRVRFNQLGGGSDIHGLCPEMMNESA